MTLLCSVLAACFFTLMWYHKAPESKMLLSVPCFLFWGASLMWFVDAIFEYRELGAAYFTPEPLDMLNDLFLGLSVIALGLIIWIVILLLKDPKGVIKQMLVKKK